MIRDSKELIKVLNKNSNFEPGNMPWFLFSTYFWISVISPSITVLTSLSSFFSNDAYSSPKSSCSNVEEEMIGDNISLIKETELKIAEYEKTITTDKEASELLEKELEQGEYKPLTIAQAVERCKDLLYLFNKKKRE